MVFWRQKSRPQPAASEQELDPDSTSLQFLTGDAFEDQRRTEALLEEVAAISGRVARVTAAEDLDELLTYIVDASIARTGAERGLLVLAQDDGGPSVRVARQHGGRSLTGDVRYSTSAVRKVVETGRPLKDVFNSSAEAMDLGASVFDLKLRALMCVPLEAGEAGKGLRGVLYVDSKAARGEFGAQDLSYFLALSVQISVALKSAALHLDSIERARLEQSLENAKVVQSNLMPQIPRDFPGIDVFGWFRAAEGTSGDFYDFFKTRDGRLAVIVGDVTGHGPASALITSQAQASLRASIRIIPDLCEAVTMVNEDLAERTDDGNFVTLFVALFSPDGTVQVLNAGHTPPQVWQQSTGEVRRVSAHGPALGMMEDFSYSRADTFELNVGDVILGFTDGITEARHPSRPDDLLGEDGLEARFRAGAEQQLDASALTEALVSAVIDFNGDTCEDDMTMVAVRCTPIADR